MESLGAAVLWVGHAIAGVPIVVQASFGSDNLVGPLPDAVAVAQGVALVLVLAGIWAGFVRVRTSGDQQLVAASAGAVCAFVLLGKVLSGQYLLWLLPLVALMDGRRGILAAVALVAALVLTQQWYPAHYVEWLAGRDPNVAWIVLVRDLTLALLLGLSVVPGEWIARATGWLTVPRAPWTRSEGAMPA